MNLEQEKDRLAELACFSMGHGDDFKRRGPKEIRRIIHKLMNNGLYDESFLGIIEEQDQPIDEFLKHFKRACQFLDISFPETCEEATLFRLKKIVSGALHKNQSVVAGPMSDIYNVYVDISEDAYDIRDFISFYYSYDYDDPETGKLETLYDIYESQKEEIDAEFFEICRKWSEKYVNK